jgi:hypothetical protein
MFCDEGGKVNKEHIFGDQLAKRFPKAGPALIARSAGVPPPELLTKQERRKFYRSGGGSILASTSSSMCENCNEHFGRNQQKIIPALYNLISGKSSTFVESQMHGVQTYFKRLAAIVDLETSPFDPDIMDEGQSDLERSVFYRRFELVLDRNYRRAIREDLEVGSQVRTFLSRYEFL